MYVIGFASVICGSAAGRAGDRFPPISRSVKPLWDRFVSRVERQLHADLLHALTDELSRSHLLRL